MSHISDNPDYFEAMESQYLVQNENFELKESNVKDDCFREPEPDEEYYTLQGLCPQCKGWGEVIDTRGFGIEPCFNPDCCDGTLRKNKDID